MTVLWDFRNGRIDPPPVGRTPSEQEKLDAAGSYPISPLVQAGDGNFYRVTYYANNAPQGVLYTLSAGGAFKGLYLFKGENGRGAASLIAASDGNLYGTCVRGDANCPHGTVFKATRSGVVSILHKFDFTNGAEPYHLMQASDGNLYGTASKGCTAGAAYPGCVYRLALSGDYKVLHAFNGTDEGTNPFAGVAAGLDGYLYGATYSGEPPAPKASFIASARMVRTSKSCITSSLMPAPAYTPAPPRSSTPTARSMASPPQAEPERAARACFSASTSGWGP